MSQTKQKKKHTPQINTPRSIWNNVFFYAMLIFLFWVIFGSASQLDTTETKPLSETIQLIKEKQVQDIVVNGDTLAITLQNGSKFSTKKESSVSFDEILTNNSVDRSLIAGSVQVEDKLGLLDILTPVLTFGFPILILFILLRQMKGASGDIMAFGRSKAKIVHKGTSKVTFSDIAGAAEAKTEMMEIVDFLKNPKKYQKLGARIPKGVLLVGQSGVGKTLLAKAIAGEANVPFFSVAGSEFMEMLVGVGSARARDLFRQARETQPSLIFIDEIDAIGRQRGMGIGGGHDEREQTLNQILIEMDGFDPRTTVIVIAATNRPDMLDPALVRPGRFDRRISIPLPDVKEREEIAKIHMRGKPFVKDFDIVSLAKKTVQFSGADIENMINESAILAARAERSEINMSDIDEAILKVTLGSERNIIQTVKEKEMTAYHEAGHALVATFVPDMDSVDRVSIVARGASLGHTSYPPDRDIYNVSETRIKSMIASALGGRAAEEVVYKEFSAGASSDIKHATELSKRMVTELGMSSLGPVNYSGDEAATMLARELGHHSLPYSQEIAAKIDSEVKKIIDNAYITAVNILTEKRQLMDALVKRLMEKETILADEYKEICKNFS